MMDNKKLNIAIIGGATSGWMAAAWLKKIHPNHNITVVESPQVPRIGVGESVTVHVTEFLRVLELDETDAMYATGAVYKYGNDFINWVHGKGENELFTFSFNKNKQHLHSSPYGGAVWDSSLEVTANDTRLTDYWLDLKQKGIITKSFDQTFTGFQNFCDKGDPRAPFLGSTPYLPPNDLIYAYHINAEKFGDYIRDKSALPNGVNHKLGHVSQVVKSDAQSIEKVVLDTGEEIYADFFLDCTGFHRVLMKEFSDKIKWQEYPHCPADRSMVCQVEYNDPKTEMVNVTKSIAADNGWCFDIGVYNRRGTGYVFSNDFVSDDEVYDEYTKKMITGKAKFEPKIIAWDKKSMKNPGFGNVCAIGMTVGFVEPMEANMLGVILNTVWTFTNLLTASEDDKTIDWDTYNTLVGHTYSDIADFISVHYTLTQRTDTDFWNEMQSWGRKYNHKELLIEKYNDYKNTINGAAQGLSFFPDYMWIELADAWGVDLSQWPNKTITDDERELAKLHFEYVRTHMGIVSKQFPNYYEFLKEHRFQGLTSNEWHDKMYG